MNVAIIPATISDYPIIQNLARFYVYDRSGFMGWGCEKDGMFECIDFKEISILSENLDKVLFLKNKLADNSAKLQKLNQELEEQVSDRTVRLDKALGVKSEVLNNLSHEIRTPLAGVIGLTDGLVFSWSQLSEQKKLEILNLIHQSGKRLLSYLGNILDLDIFAISGT